MVVRHFGSLSKVYFYVHLRMRKGISQRDCYLSYISIWLPQIIKSLGSNKSNYGSDHRAVSIPWIPVLYKKRKRIAEAVSSFLLVAHPPAPFCYFFVRAFGSLSKVYFYLHLRMGNGFSQRDCCLFYIGIWLLQNY